MKGSEVIDKVQRLVGTITKILVLIFGLVFLSVDLIPDSYMEYIEIVSTSEHEQGADEKEIENEDAKEYFNDKVDYSAKSIESDIGLRFFSGGIYKYSLLDLITPPPEHLEFSFC